MTENVLRQKTFCLFPQYMYVLFSRIVSYFLSSSQGPLRGFLVECSSSYLANPTCLIVTRKITPGPFVFVINKNNTFFFLIIVGFTLVPEYHLWVKWFLVHPMPLAVKVLIPKSQEIWKSSIQKLSDKVLLSPCADGGQVTSHPRAVAFTLSPRLVVIKRKIAVGPEGSPAHRTAIPGAPFQFRFLSDTCHLWVLLWEPEEPRSFLTG